MKRVLRSQTGSDAGEAGPLLPRLERAAFGSAVGALFALGLIVLVCGAATFLAGVLGEPHRAIAAGGILLDAALLAFVLLLLACALLRRLQGAGLGAEPFVIVAILAIVRQLLGLTAGGTLDEAASVTRIAALAAAGLVFAAALAAIRRKPLR